MATIVETIKVDDQHLDAALQKAAETVASGGGEVALDFSSVSRIDVNAVAKLRQLAYKAGEKGSTVVLQSVNVEVYKVLKLVKLASQFSCKD